MPTGQPVKPLQSRAVVQQNEDEHSEPTQVLVSRNWKPAGHESGETTSAHLDSPLRVPSERQASFVVAVLLSSQGVPTGLTWQKGTQQGSRTQSPAEGVHGCVEKGGGGRVGGGGVEIGPKGRHIVV